MGLFYEKGKLHCANGDTYEGEFKDEVYDG